MATLSPEEVKAFTSKLYGFLVPYRQVDDALLMAEVWADPANVFEPARWKQTLNLVFTPERAQTTPAPGVIPEVTG